jgi:peroxiredoxin
VIAEGTEAPLFELPAWHEGRQQRIGLEEYLGDNVVILTFYPADFNPACGEESDLDELDLFTMQKDVAVLAVGPDSLYSHAQFADAYDLHIPLLSDGTREVAAQYGVRLEDAVGQTLAERAVAVIDHDGIVQYSWSTTSMKELPPVGKIKDAIAETGGDETAFARYRVGMAHYTEARRAFTSAMHAYRDSEWMMAQSDFKRAREEFDEAVDHFDSAVRFVDYKMFEGYYDEAKDKASSLWQAADWLTQSANAYSSGAGAEAQRLRDDAEAPLETARDIGEPIDPDEWPPEPDDPEESGSFLQQPDDEDEDLTLELTDPGDGAGGENGDSPLAVEESDQDPTPSEPRERDPADDGGTIDDAEIEELTAEIADSGPDESADGDEDLLEEGEVETPAAPSESEAAEPATPAADDDGSPLEAGEREASEAGDGEDSDAEAGEPAPDPDADLSAGGGGVPSGVSGSLEVEDDDEDLGEPEGASDEDLADIPTADELEAEDDDAEE